MFKRLIHLLPLMAVSCLVLAGVAQAVDPSLVGWWKFNETSGTTALDSSGNGNNGTLMNSPSWVTGQLEGAIQFDGTSSYVECGNAASLNMTEQVTLAAWINPAAAGNGQHQCFVIKGDMCYALKHNTGNYMEFNVYDGTWYTARGPAVTAATFNNTWHHVAGTYDGNLLRIYVEGELQSTFGAESHVGRIATSGSSVSIGRDNDGGGRRYYNGLIDDARIYNRALSDAEILVVMKGADNPGMASVLGPKDNATDVPVDAVLSWKPGGYPGTHDVYFGTAFDDVNNAGKTSPLLVSQGQSATTYDPAGVLAFGQTYYWRVDEVNSTDGFIHKGQTWNFTNETYGYPITTPIIATASSFSNVLTKPDKTIDGSGITGDVHSTVSSQMWLSKKNLTPIWIQYEFNQEYKLHQMWVWNQNQLTELDMGVGAKDVTVEVSTDGTTWTAVAGVPEFAQGTGEDTYEHNTTVDFGGVSAKFVRLTINTNWAETNKQAGLSEVRFFYVPVKAFGPSPASGAADVAMDEVLNWRPGREAAKHELSLGTDPNALAPVKTLTDHTYGLGSAGLAYGQTYYWRVDEVNDAATPASWTGDVWSFSTVGYTVVEDFESYDDLCNRVFYTWVDKYGYSTSSECGGTFAPGNGSNGAVGNDSAPYADKAIRHGGSGQSMPLFFDNTTSPYYSEAQREWATPQTWTGGGANTLRVYLRGEAAAFAETSAGTIVMNGTGTDIWNTTDEFRFVYKTLKGNGSLTAKVESVAVTDAWSKAGVMIRETLDAASTHAMSVVSGSSGISFQRRIETGGTSTATDATGLAAPYWVKITRNGNTFTAQQSVDGVTWVDLAATPAITIAMANDVYIGLVVTSHAAGVVCGAKFSNVSSTGGVSGSWQVGEIGISQTNGNTPETCYVGVQDLAGKLKVVTQTDPSVIATGVWEEWNIPLSEFTSAGVNLNNVRKLIIGVGDRTAPKAGSSGKVNIDDIRLTRVVP